MVAWSPMNRGGEFELSDVHDAEYAEMGMDRKDITAKFLSEAEKINEILVECYDDEEEVSFTAELLSMSFSDGEHEYPVSPAVIADYNAFMSWA